MKYLTILLFGFSILTLTSTALAQKYTTAEDTVKLNSEYLKVSNDIADLTARLDLAKKNLPGYHTTAANAESNAEASAATSSDRASKATNGNLKDAKRAEKQAKRAYISAKKARSADRDVNKQDDKITDLTSALYEKQQRLQELDLMRNDINAKLPLQGLPQMDN